MAFAEAYHGPRNGAGSGERIVEALPDLANTRGLRRARLVAPEMTANTNNEYAGKATRPLALVGSKPWGKLRPRALQTPLFWPKKPTQTTNTPLTQLPARPSTVQDFEAAVLPPPPHLL